MDKSGENKLRFSPPLQIFKFSSKVFLVLKGDFPACNSPILYNTLRIKMKAYNLYISLTSVIVIP